MLRHPSSEQEDNSSAQDAGQIVDVESDLKKPVSCECQLYVLFLEMDVLGALVVNAIYQVQMKIRECQHVYKALDRTLDGACSGVVCSMLLCFV